MRTPAGRPWHVVPPAATAYGDDMDETLARLHGAPPEHVVGRTVTLRRWTFDHLDAQLEAIAASLPALARWLLWATGGYDPHPAAGLPVSPR